MLRTRSPLSHPRIATLLFSLDLHVLTTPPAFTLSQNQTLRKIFFKISWSVQRLYQFLIDSLDFFLFKVFRQKNFWQVRTIVLSKFQRTFPSLIPNSPPLPKPLVWIWKGRPLRRFRFRLSILFFENFHFFQKSFSTSKELAFPLSTHRPFRSRSFEFEKARTCLSPFNSPPLPKPLVWIWKGYPLRRFRLLLSISFFKFFFRSGGFFQTRFKVNSHIGDRLALWKLWFASSYILSKMQALF